MNVIRIGRYVRLTAISLTSGEPQGKPYWSFVRCFENSRRCGWVSLAAYWVGFCFSWDFRSPSYMDVTR